MTVRLRSASTTVSTCVVPLPLPLPLAVLADTYQPVCAPMLKPISPLPLLFFDDCVWSSASLRRVMLSRAASATLFAAGSRPARACSVPSHNTTVRAHRVVM
jgi:hypothetical protein